MAMRQEDRDAVESMMAAVETASSDFLAERTKIYAALMLDLAYPAGDHIHPIIVIDDAKAVMAAKCDIVKALLT